MSFSAPLPGARVTSLCLAKEKSPRERPPREHALRPPMGSGSASGRRGSRRHIRVPARIGAHPVRHPSDWSAVRSPCSRGPCWARILRAVAATQIAWSCFERGQDGRRRSRAFPRPLCCGVGRTKRPAGRSEANAREARAQGIAPTCRRAMDGVSASPAGPHGFFVHAWTKNAAPGWPFSGPPFFGHAKKGGSPAREAGEKRQGCRTSTENVLDSGSRPLRGLVRNDGHW
jgi:hypothetical protein